MHKLKMIVAADLNNAIGKHGKIPWKLSSDMKHFSDTTSGKAVVMGRKTFDSIPEKFRPLPGRANIIMTRDYRYRAPGCIVVHSIDDVFKLAEVWEVFVIGGAEIYDMFLPFTKTIILTRVNTIIEGADAFFPQVPKSWEEKILFTKEADEKNQFSFSVVKLIKVH